MLELKDWAILMVSIASVCISIASMYYAGSVARTVNRENLDFQQRLANSQFAERRRDQTVRLLETWSSDHMRSHRSKAADAFASRDGTITLSNEPNDVQSSVDVVAHFFRDLSILFEDRSVHNTLSKRLFAEDVKWWIPNLNRFDFGTDQEWYDNGARKALDIFAEPKTPAT